MPQSSQGLPVEIFIFLAYVCPKHGEIIRPLERLLFHKVYLKCLYSLNSDTLLGIIFKTVNLLSP